MKRCEAIGIGLLSLLLVTAGCQIIPPSFSQTAGTIGSAFAAAETTLRYAHEGKITYAYAAVVAIVSLPLEIITGGG